PGPDRGELHGSEDFVLRKDILSGRVPAWEHEELVGRHSPIARRSAQHEGSAESDQRWRRIRRMHDVTRTASEDRVELVVSGERGSLATALRLLRDRGGLAQRLRARVREGLHASAPRIRARVIGVSCSRLPDALKIALPIAAGARMMPASPMLFAPNGPYP